MEQTIKDFVFEKDKNKALKHFTKNGVLDLFKENGLNIRFLDETDEKVKPLVIECLEHLGTKLEFENVENDLVKSVAQAKDNLDKGNGIFSSFRDFDSAYDDFVVFENEVYPSLHKIEDVLVKSKAFVEEKKKGNKKVSLKKRDREAKNSLSIGFDAEK